MGSTYNFTCDSCGYSVAASGGVDYGMVCATATIKAITPSLEAPYRWRDWAAPLYARPSMSGCSA